MASVRSVQLFRNSTTPGLPGASPVWLSMARRQAAMRSSSLRTGTATIASGIGSARGRALVTGSLHGPRQIAWGGEGYAGHWLNGTGRAPGGSERLLQKPLDPFRLGLADRPTDLRRAFVGDQRALHADIQPFEQIFLAVEVDVEDLQILEAGVR